MKSKTLDEVVARDPARVNCLERAGRGSNPLNLSVSCHVLRTGSQVRFSLCILIDEGVTRDFSVLYH